MLSIRNLFSKIVLGPKREVISIYKKLSTPKDRDPYLIEVYLYVAVSTSADMKTCGKESEFYKYVIYNHTSCKFECPIGPRGCALFSSLPFCIQH